MRKAGLILLAGIFIGPAANATSWWTITGLKRFCNRLLTPVSAQNSSGQRPLQVSEEYRAAFNKVALQSTRALLVFEPTHRVELIDAGQLDLLSWLDVVARRPIEGVLDARLPAWRNNKFWYFQTAAATALFTPKSLNPIEFESRSYILMTQDYAIGQIHMVKYPYLELFD